MKIKNQVNILSHWMNNKLNKNIFLMIYKLDKVLLYSLILTQNRNYKIFKMILMLIKHKI
jgi:hypothetical protein